MDGMISVWVNKENYDTYENGEVAIGWATQMGEWVINLMVPIKQVTGMQDWGREGLEINIQR